MDRGNEEMEKSLGAASNQVNTTNDDDTSTESSDTFDSWTLLNDKEKLKTVDKLDDSVNRIEILKDNDPDEHDDKADNDEEEKSHKNCEGAQKQE